MAEGRSVRERIISLRVAKDWGEIREAEGGLGAGGGAQQRGSAVEEAAELIMGRPQA